MKRGFFAAGPVLAIAWLAGCVDGGFGPAVRESVSQTRPMSPTGRLSLENTNGSVHVGTWDEPRVRIDATKTAATRQALERLEVAIDGEGDRIAIRTRQPHGGFFLHRAAGVEYSVTVPRGARVSVRNVNGKVEIEGVMGPVQASTVNGSIEANDLGSEVEASTTNGSVEVEMARVDPSGHNRLSTTNGSVRLVLPRDVGADVEAHTVNGAVHCEFDLAADTRVSRRSIEGRIGSGGARFELRTVNGSTHVERGLATASAAASQPRAEATPAAEVH
jgi:hypothetical protein